MVILMKNNSIWSEYHEKKNRKSLNEDLEIDVLIIGGGLTGISTAYNLINSNLKVVLVERNKIGLGVTSKSTAKITYLQENIYSKLKIYHNEETSKKYLESQIDAINILTNIIKKNNIECDLEESNSYLFTNKNNKVKKIKTEQHLLNKFGIKTKIEKLPDGTGSKYAFKVNNTYVFNPIKYLNSLANIIENNNINIYENTKIEKIIKKDNYYLCKTNKNTIKTKYFVLASHYPYFLFPFFMPIKTKLEKSYIKAYQIKESLKFNAINIEKPTESIRYYTNKEKTYKIVLTESHNICIKNNEKENFNKLKKINNEPLEYYWSNIDIVTNDYLPFIGELDNNLLIGTGYNTWGMTNSCIAGKIISDIILNRNNKYIKLFNPKRNINLGKIISFPIIVSSNVYSFIKTKIKLNKSWYRKNIRFETKNGKKVGIYTDKNKKEHIVYTICPHLKCNLIFNEIELTWDCPCHGSRFDIDGKCIEGPSNYNISYKDNN